MFDVSKRLKLLFVLLPVLATLKKRFLCFGESFRLTPDLINKFKKKTRPSKWDTAFYTQAGFAM